MPWDGSPGGGFTGPGVTPWLPMADPPVSAPLAPGETTPPSLPAGRTVAGQRNDPGSVLSLSRRLLALRRAELGHGLADFENLAVTRGVWAYRTGQLVVAVNFTGHPVDVPAAVGEVLLSTSAEQAPPSPGLLRPWEGVITRQSG